MKRKRAATPVSVRDTPSRKRRAPSTRYWVFDTFRQDHGDAPAPDYELVKKALAGKADFYHVQCTRPFKGTTPIRGFVAFKRSRAHAQVCTIIPADWHSANAEGGLLHSLLWATAPRLRRGKALMFGVVPRSSTGHRANPGTHHRSC